jgi:TRAP transporter 4TM/12TM fusion protein
MEASTRYRKLSLPFRILFVASTVLGTCTTIYYVFNFTLFGAMLDVGARYLAVAFFLPFVFILIPPAGNPGKTVPWYDMLAAVLACGIPIYFFANCWEIIYIGWTYPTPFNFALGAILCLLVLEGGRRTGGLPYLLICIILGLFPLFADKTPGVFRGIPHEWFPLIAQHSFGSETGIAGLPSRIMVDILIGFLIFAAVLLASGGGKAFLDLASALMGRYRGGQAKIAVVGSGFFGSISGSALANVVGTGSFTIPAMKKMGYPPHYAGAIEACASSGGILMPPVMGAVAFVMAEFLGVPYADIIICAAIPAMLFYFGLLMQVDAFAARTGLRGLSREDVPLLSRIAKEAWHFGIAFIFLIWGLLYMRWEEMTPFYASALLIVLSMFRKETRIGPRRFVDVIEQVGRLIVETMGVFLPIAFIVNGLSITGVAPAFTHGLVLLSGGNPFIALLFGAVACFILGMMGMVTPAYIFLAISMAPALVGMGFNEIAVHLFIIYIAMLAGITPPVAAAAFVGANIAGAPPMKTAWQASRLGIVVYLIPFFFVYNASLVFKGPPDEILYNFAVAIIGITFIAAGVEGWLWLVGIPALWLRLPLTIGGFLLVFPEMLTDVIGIALVIVAVAILLVMKVIRRSSAGAGTA